MFAAGAAFADGLPGTVWLTESQTAKVKFELDDAGALVGRFVWLEAEEEDGVVAVDAENPDPELQDRPLIGLAFVWGFEQKNDAWVGGRIYNPEDGKTYRSRIEAPEGDTLHVKGCVGPFCQTQEWTKVDVTEAAAEAVADPAG